MHWYCLSPPRAFAFSYSVAFVGNDWTQVGLQCVDLRREKALCTPSMNRTESAEEKWSSLFARGDRQSEIQISENDAKRFSERLNEGHDIRRMSSGVISVRMKHIIAEYQWRSLNFGSNDVVHISRCEILIGNTREGGVSLSRLLLVSCLTVLSWK